MADQTNNELFPNQSVSIKKIKRLKYFGHKTTGYYDLFLSSMSGDTTDRQIFKKKEEETAPLVSDRTKLQPAPSDGLPSEIEKTGNTEEKQEFLKQDKEESKVCTVIFFIIKFLIIMYKHTFIYYSNLSVIFKLKLILLHQMI